LGATAGVAPDATGNIPTTGWSIQVSEHASEADALQEVASLSAADMPAYSVVALVEGKVRWRVRIGGYANKDAANAAIPAVVAKAGVPSASATMAP
jgi:cell division septation protein DedD